MSVTTIELQENLQMYLEIAKTEKVYISENGVIIAILTPPRNTKIDALNSLIGIIPSDASLEDSKAERLSSI